MSPAFAGVNVISRVPGVLPVATTDALATAGVPLDTVGVAPLLHIAVIVLFVPYVPLTIVPLPLATVVPPSLTVVVLLTFAPVKLYVTSFASY